MAIGEDEIPEYTTIVDVDEFLCDDFLYYAGYYNATKILINFAIKGNFIEDEYGKELDCDKNILIFPIYYMYRHYIELSIKDLIHELDDFENERLTIFKQHTIPNIFEILKNRYSKIIKNIPQKYGGRLGLEYYQNVFANFDKFNTEINSINEIDPSAINFRYSKNKNNPELKNFPNEKPIEINLTSIRESIDKFKEFFENVLFSIVYLNEQ